jgi:hypothetical protein
VAATTEAEARAWFAESGEALPGDQGAVDQGWSEFVPFLGMRQRRADARATLHEALAYVERAGAEPWAEARAELPASGETPSTETTNGSLADAARTSGGLIVCKAT